MIVIIPHPDDELKIIKLQNELIKELYQNINFVFYKHFPLWIPLINTTKNDTNKNNLIKSTGKIIKKVSFGSFQYENNQIVIEVTISTEKESDKNDFKEKLILLNGSIKNQEFTEKSIKEIDFLLNNNFKEIIKQLKIFRIGAVHQLSDKSASISDSVWCKLK